MIDCHVHFWSYHKEDFPWIKDVLQPIAQNMTPDKLWQCIDTRIHQIIAVQARTTIDENHFLCELAKQNDQIKGIIGWFDFNQQAKTQIEKAQQHSVIKGFRHLVQDELNPSDYLLHHPGIKRAMTSIQSNGFVYELLVHQKDLDAAVKFCSTYDQHYIVIDHLAKPIFHDEDAFTKWQKSIQALHHMDHVIMKISGLVTEGGKESTAEIFQRHIDTVVQVFGTNRLLWGSDWPVSFATHDYTTLINFWDIWTKNWSNNEKLQVEEKTAQRVYKF